MTAVLTPPDVPAPASGDDRRVPTVIPPREGRPWGAIAFDVVVLSAVSLVALSGFRTSFGTRYLLVGGVGLALGVAIALLGALVGRKPWPVPVTVLVTLVVFFVVGDWLIQPARSFAVAAPSAGSVRSLATGLFRGWINLLTTSTPVGGAQGLLVIPWACGLVCGVACVSMTLRMRRAAISAVLPPLAVLIVAIVVGTDQVAWPWQATVFALLAAVWASVRQRRVRIGGVRGTARPRWASGIGVLALVAVAGTFLGQTALVGGTRPRRVVREEVKPPADVIELPSPLEGFRRYRAADRRRDVLFRVAGLQRGDVLRLTTLTYYDGVVWRAQGAEDAGASDAYRRVGDRLPVEPTSATDPGVRRSITVSVEDYEGPWVPSIGAAERVSFRGARAVPLSSDFRYNPHAASGVVPSGLRRGDRYEVEALVPSNSSVQSGAPDASVGRTPIERSAAISKALPALVRDGARTEPSDGSALAKARAVERFLRGVRTQLQGKAGYSSYFSDGRRSLPSLGGHDLERMKDLVDLRVRPYLVGNEEQYASAMALAADELGLPVRLVMGFAPRGTPSGSIAVLSGDITAWVEVAVDGHGWVRLSPTPPKDRVPPPVRTVTKPPADRLVLPPPVTVPRSDAAPSGQGGGGLPSSRSGSGEGSHGISIPGWAPVVGAIALPPLLIVGGVTALMALLKGRRRKKRRTTGTPARRVSGGWAEVCDVAADLGDVVPDGATRRETAVLLARPGVGTLARSADSLVFGPSGVDPIAAEQYWREVDVTRSAMLASAGRWGRWKALVNPSSLRRRRALSSGEALEAKPLPGTDGAVPPSTPTGPLGPISAAGHGTSPVPAHGAITSPSPRPGDATAPAPAGPPVVGPPGAAPPYATPDPGPPVIPPSQATRRRPPPE